MDQGLTLVTTIRSSSGLASRAPLVAADPGIRTPVAVVMLTILGQPAIIRLASDDPNSESAAVLASDVHSGHTRVVTHRAWVPRRRLPIDTPVSPGDDRPDDA